MASRKRPRGTWARRYPPLTGAVVAGVLAVFVLPSALNVPRSNPAQTLEFAPVPPEDDQPPPPDGGDVESLGLGSSSTAPAGEAPGGDGLGLPPPPAVPEGVGERPVTKRCVGEPPRQTEDPLSPPCVAHFEGDNGGATYQGVTREEIRILLYLEGGFCDGSTDAGRYECRPNDELVDLAQPEQPDDHLYVRTNRRLQRYFNDRYQTYGRSAHFWIYFDRGSDSSSPEGRRADAVANIDAVDPFAILAYPFTFEDDYLNTAAGQGVLNFGSRLGRRAAFFQTFPGMIWSFPPSIEQFAAVYADYVCTKVVPYSVSFSGNGDIGEPRRLGWLTTTDERQPQFQHFASIVRRQIEECGGEFVAEGTYPVARDSTGVRGDTGENNQTAAAANMARFQQEDVTTVIWPQGYETEHSKAADRIGYEPEWVLAGDRQFEGSQTGALQNQEVWEHAWVVTPMPLRREDTRDGHCWRAQREADPDARPNDADHACAFQTFYEDLRMLFTGIQVAGPQLTPTSIDQGFHAIPRVRSTDPHVPACFFNPGDYTCIKDAAAAWWDPGGDENRPAGCWRFAEHGQRHFAGDWPPGDVIEQRNADDPCQNFIGPFSG